VHLLGRALAQERGGLLPRASPGGLQRDVLLHRRHNDTRDLQRTVRHRHELQVVFLADRVADGAADVHVQAPQRAHCVGIRQLPSDYLGYSVFRRVGVHQHECGGRGHPIQVGQQLGVVHVVPRLHAGLPAGVLQHEQSGQHHSALDRPQTVLLAAHEQSDQTRLGRQLCVHGLDGYPRLRAVRQRDPRQHPAERLRRQHSGVDHADPLDHPTDLGMRVQPGAAAGFDSGQHRHGRQVGRGRVQGLGAHHCGAACAGIRLRHDHGPGEQGDHPDRRHPQSDPGLHSAAAGLVDEQHARLERH